MYAVSCHGICADTHMLLLLLMLIREECNQRGGIESRANGRKTKQKTYRYRVAITGIQQHIKILDSLHTESFWIAYQRTSRPVFVSRPDCEEPPLVPWKELKTHHIPLSPSFLPQGGRLTVFRVADVFCLDTAVSSITSYDKYIMSCDFFFFFVPRVIKKTEHIVHVALLVKHRTKPFVFRLLQTHEMAC